MSDFRWLMALVDRARRYPDAKADQTRARWGLVVTQALAARLDDFEVGAACRDSIDIESRDFPAVLCGANLCDSTKGLAGRLGLPACAGETSVGAGDLTVEDADGVVVIPCLQRNAVPSAAEEKLPVEKQRLDEIREVQARVVLVG